MGGKLNMKKYSKLLGVALIICTIISPSLPVFGATQFTDIQVQAVTSNDEGAASMKSIKEAQRGIYNQETINAEWAKAKKKPIMADKASAKSLTNEIVNLTTGTYPTRKGVILVTADWYKGLLPTGHSGIIWSNTTVVESLANGVTTGPNNWNLTKNSCYGVTTYDTTAEEDALASDWCYSQIGKPYNYNYFNPYTRSSFYCSQLVYASYLDLYSINLDTFSYLNAVHPMELVNSSETFTIYQK